MNPHIRAKIEAMLCSGISPARAAHAIFHTFGAVVSVSEIKVIRDELPPGAFLPVRELAKQQMFVDVEIDVVQEMSRLLQLELNRLDAMVLKDELVGSGASTDVDAQTAKIFDMLERLSKMRQGLGELPSEPMKLALSRDDDSLPSLNELLREGEGLPALPTPEALPTPKELTTTGEEDAD